MNKHYCSKCAREMDEGINPFNGVISFSCHICEQFDIIERMEKKGAKQEYIDKHSEILGKLLRTHNVKAPTPVNAY